MMIASNFIIIIKKVLFKIYYNSYIIIHKISYLKLYDHKKRIMRFMFSRFLN